MNFIKKNDLLMKIYLAFFVMLILTAVTVGSIFIYMYRDMYVSAYKNTLIKQGNNISSKISSLASENKSGKYLKYISYIEELEQSDQTEVWVLSNSDAKNPLDTDFTNADTDSSLTDEMHEVLKKAFSGKTGVNTGHDSVYAMTILRVAVPIYGESEEVIGAVMMISMLERKSIGMKQGITIGIISVIVAILVSVLFGTILLKHVSKPLEILDKDIMRISKGDYSGVELKAKSKQINRLESALDELSGQLLKMRTDRENFDKQRKDFFANVSHELRTPITVIRGYAETLNDGVVTDEKMINDYYLRILSECENINALVEDLFALSKMENPDYKFDVEPVSLSQIMDDVVRGARVLADEKSIEIRLSKEGDETFLIIGDYARLRQMFMIIVDNAVKFSEEESFIDITLERIEGNSFRVGIRDYGVGISDEEKKNIFEKFYTSKLRQNEKGTGLGLMIAKNIALRHGSDIGLSSEPGKGSCFMFEFEECTDTSAYE